MGAFPGSVLFPGAEALRDPAGENLGAVPAPLWAEGRKGCFGCKGSVGGGRSARMAVS